MRTFSKVKGRRSTLAGKLTASRTSKHCKLRSAYQLAEVLEDH